MDQRDDEFRHDGRQATFWPYKDHNAGNTEAKGKWPCVWYLGRPDGDMVRKMQDTTPIQRNDLVRWMSQEVLPHMQA